LGSELKGMVKEGSQYHLPKEKRVELYKTIKSQIGEFRSKTPLVSLCKETFDVRQAVGVGHGECNCQR
jgi:hypothetical protein